MKYVIFALVIILPICGCRLESPEFTSSESIEYSEVLMKCIDLVSRGCKIEEVIHTQKEYDSLIYRRFTKPLQDYWNDNYESVLANVQRNNPGLTDSVYAVLVRNVFYQYLPFRGTENCSHPVIDFNRYTLLGLNVDATGCKSPEYNIFVSIETGKKEVIYKIVTTEYGTCEMGFDRNIWILISKIPESYRVIFQKQYERAGETVGH